MSVYIYVYVCIYIYLSILFYIGVQLISNAVIDSDGQQRDSARHMYVSTLVQTPSGCRMTLNTVLLYLVTFLV